jgi:tetratricopeptide (TPR) repeat protein
MCAAAHGIWRRRARACWIAAAAALAQASAAAAAAPYVPASAGEVLAYLPAGATHVSAPLRAQASTRLDVALPLAQFYSLQARASGDLRFLGYAEALLQTWRARTPVPVPVLVLHATILQSRHAFAPALAELEQALQGDPDDLQAWLTRATVLRVLGRYDEALASCQRLQAHDAAVATLCQQSVLSVKGHLATAYRTVQALPQASLAVAARAWQLSLLGEMAVSKGDPGAARDWFTQALALAPDDSYTRAAYADLLLGQGEARATLQLLAGRESMEPLLLRTALAQQQLHDPRLGASCELLQSAFEVEEQRGEAVHRREQARFLLDLLHQPAQALEAARKNWDTQHELADALILERAAAAAGRPAAAAVAADFLRASATEDVRLPAGGWAAR